MADLTDKEITEACARAMGYALTRDALGPWKHDEDGRPTYNPIQDDAQAMALVKAFKLGLSYGAEGWIVDGPASHHLEQDLNRGICKAVARMQIEKEKNA